MRQLVLVGLTVTSVLALAAVAIAQYVVPVVDITNAKIKPSQGGTKKQPRNASLDVTFEVNEESNSTLEAIDYTFPKSLRVSAKGFPACSAVDADAGECPRKSKVGTGAATALFGPGKAPLKFMATVVTAGAKKLFLVLNHELVGNVVIPARIKEQHVKFAIPEHVQSPAANLYSYITGVTAHLGPAKIGKGKKQRRLISRVGCKGGQDRVGVTLTLADNPDPPQQRTIRDTASVPCAA